MPRIDHANVAASVVGADLRDNGSRGVGRLATGYASVVESDAFLSLNGRSAGHEGVGFAAGI